MKARNFRRSEENWPIRNYCTLPELREKLWLKSVLVRKETRFEQVKRTITSLRDEFASIPD